MAHSRSGTRPDYRFARRPAWIAGHLLAGGMVLLMVILGFWQLDRLDQHQLSVGSFRAPWLRSPEPDPPS